MSRFAWRRIAPAMVLVVLAAAAAIGAGGATARTTANWYNPYFLVSDGSAISAPLPDASLVNGWGLSAGPTTPWWTSNNKTNTSTLYSGGGSKNALTVTVAGGATGTVANTDTGAFVLEQN